MGKPKLKTLFQKFPERQEFERQLTSRPPAHHMTIVEKAVAEMLGVLRQLTMSVDVLNEPEEETQDDMSLVGRTISESRFSGAVYADTLSLRPGTAPSTAASTGRVGQVVVDADYIYVCIGANTWKRAALSTF